MPQTVVMATNINTVTTVIEEEQHLTVQALADALHIPRKSICRILMQELGLKRMCAAWVLSVEGPESGLTHMLISQPSFGQSIPASACWKANESGNTCAFTACR